jgi:hypothetical protein
MVDTAQPSTSDAAQPSNVIFRSALKLYHWREWKPYIRHICYWVVAGGFIAWAATNWNPLSSVGNGPHSRGWDAFSAWLIAGVVVFLAVRVLVVTVRGSGGAPIHWARTVSRSLVFITFALGIAAVTLFQAQLMGVPIESCHMAGKHEHCEPYASERHVLGMLAWQGANVVPALDIPKSTGWSRPARSSNFIVVVTILLIRLWVAIGLLAVIKRLWDRWSAGSSSRPSTSK